MGWFWAGSVLWLSSALAQGAVAGQEGGRQEVQLSRCPALHVPSAGTRGKDSEQLKHWEKSLGEGIEP